MFRSFKTIIRDFLIYFLVELLLFILKMFKIFIKTALLSCGSTKHMLPHDNSAVFINILNILRIE